MKITSKSNPPKKVTRKLEPTPPYRKTDLEDEAGVLLTDVKAERRRFLQVSASSVT